MSSVVNQNVGNSYSCENVNETKQDPIKIFPDELVLEIFSYLNFATLGRICLVSKDWKRIASDERLWKKADVYDNAISSKKWAEWFGEEAVKDEDLEEEWRSLPWNIAGILQSRCPIFPEKRVIDTHTLVRLPKTLNGGFTLESLKKYFPINEMECQFFLPSIIQNLGDKSIDQSQWVLMTKDILPGSENKSYDEQQKIVAELAEKSLINYEVPEILEAVACIVSQYIDSNRLFDGQSMIYTYCKEKEIKNYPQVVVGNISQDGLRVSWSYKSFSVGVAALRKF